jgi:oxepin-CoA hydrolase/3-oxo-5,6-dehydrosuberyl-CoA semialdehyde dehydrogenase
MQSIFDLSPLDKLNSESKPLWGKMTAQHMVEHLILVVQSSNGTLSIDQFVTPPDRLEIAKRILMSTRPLPKNFVNTIVGEGLKPLVHPNMDSAIEKLYEEIEKFNNFYENNPNQKPVNATFGPLDKKEWEQFHKKHFNHHFEQFGLVNS